MPNCGRITVGPAGAAEKSVSVGVTAHIYSAGAGGPRGRGGLNEDELKSFANAIWLCSNHGALVDKNDGQDYPASVLISYKALHEARIARELQGMPSRFGWMESLCAYSSPLFATPLKLDLGKLTLLLGENETGKTALCEWIAGTTTPRYLRRWHQSWRNRPRWETELRYLDPEPHAVKISFLGDDFPRYHLDGKLSPIPDTSLQIVYPGDLRDAREKNQDDLSLLSAVLGVDPYTVFGLCIDVGSKGTDWVRRLWFEEDKEEKGKAVLYTDVRGTYAGLSFGALSGSEQIRVILELCIIMATRLAEDHPTLLILDAGGWALDNNWLNIYGEFLSAPEIGFQTLAAIPTRKLDLKKLQWVGWKVAHLQGKIPSVTLASDIRL